ncbi:prepilin-type N-terminal cleavage/methylation domain-containing protein [bacterium]|nr:prepilin-type N-terminal cleavage/methylation domain-containing protein [bacterium]
MNRRGWTLLEMLVVASLASLLLLMITGLHSRVQSQSQEPLQLVEHEQVGQYVLQHLQREIQESNLQSLRSLPDGFICESPRDFQDVIRFNDFGTVNWQKFVRYQVICGELVVDQSDSGLSLEPGQAPEPFLPTPEYRRVLARQLGSLNLSYRDADGEYRPFTQTQRGEPALLSFDLRSRNSQTGRLTLTHLQTGVRPRN